MVTLCTNWLLSAEAKSDLVTSVRLVCFLSQTRIGVSGNFSNIQIVGLGSVYAETMFLRRLK